MNCVANFDTCGHEAARERERERDICKDLKHVQEVRNIRAVYKWCSKFHGSNHRGSSQQLGREGLGVYSWQQNSK